MRGVALACLVASLTACASKPIVRTEPVEVKVPVAVPIDPALTHVAPEPELPPGEVVNDDLLDLIERLQAWGRGLAKQLGVIQELQPEPTPVK